MLLGRLQTDSSRKPGAIDKFLPDSSGLISFVASQAEAHGLYEDAVRLYDLGKVSFPPSLSVYHHWTAEKHHVHMSMYICTLQRFFVIFLEGGKGMIHPHVHVYSIYMYVHVYMHTYVCMYIVFFQGGARAPSIHHFPPHPHNNGFGFPTHNKIGNYWIKQLLVTRLSGAPPFVFLNSKFVPPCLFLENYSCTLYIMHTCT